MSTARAWTHGVPPRPSRPKTSTLHENTARKVDAKQLCNASPLAINRLAQLCKDIVAWFALR
eukprot:6292772-Amphidinium_carterae.1